MYQIVGALHNIAISRLKKAWDLVPRKEKDLFERLTELLSSLGHYKNYYTHLSKIESSEACLPIVPIALEDIQKVNELVDTYFEGIPTLNFGKLSKLSEIITNVCLYPILKLF